MILGVAIHLPSFRVSVRQVSLDVLAFALATSIFVEVWIVPASNFADQIHGNHDRSRNVSWILWVSTGLQDIGSQDHAEYMQLLKDKFGTSKSLLAGSGCKEDFEPSGCIFQRQGDSSDVEFQAWDLHGAEVGTYNATSFPRLVEANFREKI